ncbi:MAG: hypothetical protein ACLS90_05550 [Clostridia bacterium]
MNNNIDITNENKGTGAKEDKVTSAKMLQSTKNLIESLGLEGNQQEKLDTLAKGYKEFLEKAQGVAKTEVVGLDLSNEFRDFSKELDVFIKKLELKTNTYMSDTIAINIANSEKDFRIVHDEFMNYLSEVKELAISSQSESEGKDVRIEELVSEVEKLDNTVKELKENNDKLTKENEKLDKGYTNLLKKNNDLLEDVKCANAKYEREKSLRNTESDTNYKLKNDIKDLKEEIKDLKEDSKFKDTEIKVTVEKNNKLEIRNQELEVSIKELTTKNSLLEEDNKKMHNTKKEASEKTELVAQLETRNKSLEEDLKEFNVLKSKNVELEGTIKALETQTKLLENTMNTINLTITSITESRVKAEEKAITLEEENKKLLKELEELKNKSKSKSKSKK